MNKLIIISFLFTCLISRSQSFHYYDDFVSIEINFSVTDSVISVHGFVNNKSDNEILIPTRSSEDCQLIYFSKYMVSLELGNSTYFTSPIESPAWITKLAKNDTSYFYCENNYSPHDTQQFVITFDYINPLKFDINDQQNIYNNINTYQAFEHSFFIDYLIYEKYSTFFRWKVNSHNWNN
jgi:hypothetical protein